MKGILACAACFGVAACAASGINSSGLGDPHAARSAAVSDARDEEASRLLLGNVPEIEIASLPDEPVCRREFPTGSRIAVERCYAPSESEGSEDEFLNYITRRDLELMREQQNLQEQARQAREAAMRQMAVGQR